MHTTALPQPAMEDQPIFDASVLIPSRGRARALRRCLRCLSGQTLERRSFEVVIGLDGEDEAAAERVRDVWTKARDRSLRVLTLPRMGYIAARRRLLEQSRGRIAISINDDVAPEHSFVQAHLDAHDEAQRTQGVGTAIIAGESPIPRFDNETLCERLVRETDIVFFRRSPGELADRWRDWGFRHCFGLNFSAPTEALREVGGFPDLRLAYGYDDIEVAHRLGSRLGAPVLIRPEARAPHEHRFAPDDLIRREFLLGQSAWLYAKENPAFARELFRRDITSSEELAHARSFLERDRCDALRLEPALREMHALPAATVPADEAGAAVLTALAQQWTPVKRLMWRWGLVEAAAGRLVSDERPAPASVAELGQQRQCRTGGADAHAPIEPTPTRRQAAAPAASGANAYHCP